MSATTSTGDEVLKRLRPHARAADLTIDCGPGWLPIVDDCHRQVEAQFPDYELLAVKQKYGQLAVQAFPSAWKPGIEWLSRDSEVMDEITDSARARSAQTCETCGDAGQLRDIRGRLMTRCARCLVLEG